MEIQEISQRLYDSFNMDKVDQELNRRDQLKASQPVAPEPVDIYQRDQDRIYEVNKKSYPKGSRQAVNMSVYAVIDGMGAEGLAKAYKRAQDDVDSLKDQGEIRTAVGIANKLKDKIDKGEAMSDEVDYELLGRVISFYS